MTEDEWIETFKPIPDPDQHGNGYDFGEGSCLLDRRGMDHIKAADPNCVWTVIDGGEGDPVIGDGFHHVNAIGWIITRHPRPVDGPAFYEILPD